MYTRAFAWSDKPYKFRRRELPKSWIPQTRVSAHLIQYYNVYRQAHTVTILTYSFSASPTSHQVNATEGFWQNFVFNFLFCAYFLKILFICTVWRNLKELVIKNPIDSKHIFYPIYYHRVVIMSHNCVGKNIAICFVCLVYV